MYIVAIAWLYVTILMAATETSLVAGVMTFLCYGLAPLALFLWLVGTPKRRRRQWAAESVAENSTAESFGAGGTPSDDSPPDDSGPRSDS